MRTKIILYEHLRQKTN